LHRHRLLIVAAILAAVADVVAKAEGILSEPALLRAMFDVGDFPPNSPPDK
jgi:hypothetical protein